MVVIVHVSQEVIILRKDIRTAHIDRWQTDFFRITHRINVFVFIRETSPGFVTQVKTRVFITDDLRRILDVDGPVVGRDDEFESEFLRLLDDLEQR